MRKGQKSEYGHHKGHPDNHFAALHVSKNLSELERLRLMAAKLEIENERLKKDYQKEESNGFTWNYVINAYWKCFQNLSNSCSFIITNGQVLNSIRY